MLGGHISCKSVIYQHGISSSAELMQRNVQEEGRSTLCDALPPTPCGNSRIKFCFKKRFKTGNLSAS